MKDITVLCLFVFFKEFFIFFSKYELFKNAWRNFVSIKKSNDSWGNAATSPFFSQLPRQFSSTSALGDTVLTPGIALAGQELSQSQPRQNPQESQDLAPDPNRALLPKIYAPQLHLKLLPFSLSIKWFVPQFPLSPSQSLAVLGVWDVTATRDKAEKMKVNLITLFFFFFGENRYFLSLQASHKAALLLLVCSQTPK